MLLPLVFMCFAAVGEGMGKQYVVSPMFPSRSSTLLGAHWLYALDGPLGVRRGQGVALLYALIWVMCAVW